MFQNSQAQKKTRNQQYISVGLKNWKKALECLKEYQNSKCQKVSVTLEVIVSSCGDAVYLMNESLSLSQSKERQYMKVLMECIQYLVSQGIALRRNDHINDNLTQLLLLRRKDNLEIAKRLSAPSTANKRK